MGQLYQKVVRAAEQEQEDRRQNEQQEEDRLQEFRGLLGVIIDDVEQLAVEGYHERRSGNPVQVQDIMPNENNGRLRFVGIRVRVGDFWVELRPSDEPNLVSASGLLVSKIRDNFIDNTQFRDLRTSDVQKALTEWLIERDLVPPNEKGGDADAPAGLP